MCGIFGIVSEHKAPNKKGFLRALKKQHYRGPDDEKISQVSDNSLFGFNRLTIQDLNSRSMQPFEYKGNWLVFNGEIYNWKELRKEMETSGEVFYTEGDTEVLCRGMVLQGEAFLKKLNGIFAFCFFNNKDKTYTLVRDLMGVKPLFYVEQSGLMFASDVITLLDYVKPEIDEITLARYVYLDWFAAHQNERTYLKGISGLDRGSYRIYDWKGTFVKQKKFSELDFTTKITNVAQAEADFAKLMEEAMRLETRSDTEVGIFLSGGIDSTTIITHATKYLLEHQEKVPVFTKYYKEKGEDADYHFASQVMKELKDKFGYSFDHIAINMDPALTEEDIRQAIRARHAPVTDVRQISTYKLYREVLNKRGLKVVLNGQGSDEVYYGYYPLDYWLCKYYRSGEFNPNEVVNYFGNELNLQKHKIMKTEYIEDAKKEAHSYLEAAISKYDKIPEKEKRITAYFNDSILQALLQYEDNLGMFSSVEVRVPLINPLLSKYAASCDWKIHLQSTDSGRHLLRHTLTGILSKELIMRPKSPTPKRKKYGAELLMILKPYKKEIIGSELLNKVYDPTVLKNLDKLAQDAGSYSFYGNIDDTLLEIAGLFFFEDEILKKGYESFNSGSGSKRTRDGLGAVSIARS